MTRKEMQIEVLSAMLDTFKDGKAVPLGPMYAALMGVMGYETFMQIIEKFVEYKWIKVENHVGVWIREG